MSMAEKEFLYKGLDDLFNNSSLTDVKKKINSGDPSKIVDDVANRHFPTYAGNGARIDVSSLDEAFKHIDDVELNNIGNVKYKGGSLVGTHNMDNFDLQKIPNGRIREVPNSRNQLTDGVYEIKYNVLRNDGSGNFMARNDGTLKGFKKTVYDPALYPENMMKELGYKAFKDAVDNPSLFDINGPRTFKGTANGKTIHGFYKEVDGEKIIKTWWIIN